MFQNHILELNYSAITETAANLPFLQMESVALKDSTETTAFGQKIAY